MPQSQLWPAGPGSEPGTRVGSCDSIMSATATGSGSSDSSYDFLSAEEKECLLFLEETIGSLDAEADSGLSTDESEQDAAPRAPRVPPAAQPAPQGHPAERSAPRGPEPRRGPPAGPPRLPEPQGLGPRSGSYSLPRNIRIGSGQDLGRSSRPTSGPREPEHRPAGPGAETQAGGASRDGHPGPRALSPPATKAMWQEPQEGGPAPPPTPGSQAARAHDAASPAGADPGVRLAPLLAPKPRKLPPNIVLKSSRSGLHGEPQNWLSRHPDGGPGDSGPAATSLQEQRRARREALEKLGLPQDQDQPGPHFSGRTGCPGPRPRPGPQATAPAGAAPGPAPTRAPTLAWTSAPTSAPAPAPTPAPTLAPTPAPTSALTSAPIPAPTPTPAPAPAPAQASLPLPAAKSRPIPIPKAPAASSPLTQRRPDPALTLQESSIPGLRQMSFKSNTLERSGVGLGSCLPADKDPSPQTSSSLGRDSFLGNVSPNVLRNTRPRPASLGTGKDFAGVRVAELAELQQPGASKRLSFQGQGRDRLPRPPCVSVKISPKGVPDEHRREALKKLGLLKE